jgi:hypothetical protein
MVVGLKQKKEDESLQQMSVYTQIYFGEYRLDVYNKSEIAGSINSNIKDLLGSKVVETNETNEKAELFFDNGYVFIIDLREEAYSNDPDAMCLEGPNNLIVVWN